MSRDSGDYIFTEKMLENFINEGIDRLKQTIVFKDMVHLESKYDEPIILPEQYHYILALYASSRCMEYDERHYEALDKRNEFENLLTQLLADIQAERIEKGVTEEGETEYLNDGFYRDYVKDEYFVSRHGRRQRW